jgi:hypothetical protein
MAVDVSREYAGAPVVGRAIPMMGLACALVGILLESVSAEIPGIALGALGYGFATRSGDRAGQVLGVATVFLCVVSMAIPSLDLPALFLES